MKKVKVLTLTDLQAIALQEMLKQDVGIGTAYFVRVINENPNIPLDQQVRAFTQLRKLHEGLNFALEVGLRSVEKLYAEGYNMEPPTFSVVVPTALVALLLDVAETYEPLTVALGLGEVLARAGGAERLILDVAINAELAGVFAALDAAVEAEEVDPSTLSTDATGTLVYGPALSKVDFGADFTEVVLAEYEPPFRSPDPPTPPDQKEY